jgi:maleate isomerase
MGVILTTQNVVVEPEFYLMAPQGISIHAVHTASPNEDGRMSLTGRGFEDAVRCLTATWPGMVPRPGAGTRPGVIALACTAASFGRGVEYEEELRRRMERASGGVPAITTIGAVVEALKAVKAKRITLASPYREETNQREKVFLEAFDFQVAKTAGLNEPYMDQVLPERIYRFVREIWDPSCDALFVSCTNFPVVPIIETLEEDLGVPVVTSNQATLWSALKVLGCGGSVDGFGGLFSLR